MPHHRPRQAHVVDLPQRARPAAETLVVPQLLRRAPSLAQPADVDAPHGGFGGLVGVCRENHPHRLVVVRGRYGLPRVERVVRAGPRVALVGVLEKSVAEVLWVRREAVERVI
eukprot:141922-Pleurochrysis_carterae.AAC.1